MTRFLLKIKEWELQSFVKYIGPVRGEEKLELLKNTHILILPTYYPWEGQPFSIIEALAFGSPVITTRYRGIPEQIIDGYNGFFVKPQSPVEIARAVSKIARDKSWYCRMSRNAVKHYEENFTRNKYTNRVISVLLNKH